ncbi:MAG: undecaprenyl-diphosphate phosphatase [Bacteroidales bacterium]|nr:undecaprenyl-diphosphate phosphatase [Bacteroidales bacterium]MCF8386259.1 undecaprenyl-diphosphate phosphatase [Bacteroidales bacterium]MCF8397512.1 undecaprenyl-diphosphate phosphatase [Bacteroidales bacterium]
MDWIEALILGIVQGLTEFLPVSSSGHLELGKVILGVSAERSLIFTVVVHGATVMSTIVVFYKDIQNLLRGLFRFQWNEETKYITKLLFSMIPVLFIGLYFSEEVEAFFSGDLVFVGSMLIITAVLLSLTYIPRKSRRKINFLDALLIGIAQAAAVLPGISRSGATISTGLIIGNKKENIARFSFLMVLIPIIGANLKDLMDKDLSAKSDVTALPLIIGFLAAFISGLLACKWMINLVKKGKLIYFAVYCLVIGTAAILFGIL